MPSTLTKASLKNSRPLNLTRWSVDPQVSNAVDAIAAELRKLPSITRFTDRRKKALRILILDSYLRWLEDPGGSLAYSRNKNFYVIPERYNPAGIGYEPIISMVDGLADLGYVETKKGFLNRVIGFGRLSRLVAKPKLINLLEKQHKVDGSMIGVHGDTETVILRNKKKEEVDYNDTRFTRATRSLLTDYHRLLRNQYIDLDLTGYPSPVRVDLANKFVRRIFSNRSFKQGGRFYGGWWLHLPKELRPRIIIRSHPTVELDFSGMQVVQVYAESGIDYFALGKGDPYTLPMYGPQYRDLFKKVFMTLNASSRTETKRAIQKPINFRELTLPPGKSVEDILTEFEAFHSTILPQFYAGNAGHFQFLDSIVAERVIDYMTRIERSPVLCIHDSFIVISGQENVVRDAMADALSDVLIQHTPLTSVDPKIKKTDHWVDKSKQSGVQNYSLPDIARDPTAQRMGESYSTKRQGFLTYEPSASTPT